MGAAGAFGAAVSAELMRRGERVRALVRRAGSAPEGTEEVVGDAADAEALERAADGVATIFWGARPPLEREPTHLLPLVDALTSVAARRRVTVVFPTTTDGLKLIYDVPLPADAPLAEPIDRPNPQRRVRRLAEDQLQVLAEVEGVRVVLVRSVDWFGPRVRTDEGGAMLRAVAAGEPLPWFGPFEVGHAFAFVEDVARVAVDFRALEGRPTWEVAPVGGTFFAGAPAFAEAVAAAAGRPVPLRRVWPAMVQARALFDRRAAAFAERLYLWRGAILLDDTRSRRLVGYEPTPAAEALARTLAWYRENPR